MKGNEVKCQPVGIYGRFEKKKIVRYHEKCHTINLIRLFFLDIELNPELLLIFDDGFRRWATECLKEYMIKGFIMDDNRLKI